MAALPSASAGTSKSYRFAPTRELRASYETVVPVTFRHDSKTTALGEYLKLKEEETTNGEMTRYSTARDAHVITTLVGEEKEYPVLLPPVDTPVDVECGEDRSVITVTKTQNDKCVACFVQCVAMVYQAAGTTAS